MRASHLAFGLLPLLIAVACGDPPSVITKKPPLGTGGSAGSGTGGSGGRGATGGTGGSIGVGAMGGEDPGEGGGPPIIEAECGNDELEPGELCDDGNTDDDDGCSGDCSEADPDYLCVEGQGCIRVVTCGNGVIEGDEVCDDGDTDGSDGCAAACDEVEDGYSCIKPGEDCVALSVCGNGVRERGEQCDDDNADDDDGCNAMCEVEPGYFCPPGRSCVALECGDGNRTPDEACDDGDTDPGDGCAADCTVEDGFICSASGCKGICGDGNVVSGEDCDDANLASGDGCSAACKVEPFFDCDDAEPSVCTSIIVCGDGVLHPGEVCDPGISGQDACLSPMENASLACKAFDSGVIDPPQCNNGVVEFMEECDGAVTGCTNCTVDDGYVCPAANVCFRLPVCGDGLLQGGEECDIGLMSGPGCVNCVIQTDYFCSGEPSVCVRSVCGDGFRAPDEQCDDGPGTVNNPGTPMSGDGCSATCTVETGYACPPMVDCLAVCGDGLIRGGEECDTPDTTACENCKIRPGYDCGPNGTDNPCTAAVCGNDDLEPGEGCDDGNLIAGDDCGPTCQIEPTVDVGPEPQVAVTCGDGLKTNNEGCDDGNDDSGDGCSSSCAVESGWTCEENIVYPDQVEFKVVYRDFKQRSETGGHPHMKRSGQTPPSSGNDPGIVGVLCTVDEPDDCGRLDDDGKPTYVGTGSGTHVTIDPSGDSLSPTYHQAAFSLWYRDSNMTVNDALSEADGNSMTNNLIVIDRDPEPMPSSGMDTLVLGRVGTTSAYRFSNNSNTFYPLGSASSPAIPVRGWGYTPEASPQRNWQFTSELRSFFQYQGGETLTFFGDDDVWVFVNGRLAVDIGGIHNTLNGRVVLGDDGSGNATESDCSINGSDNVSSTNLTACTREVDEMDDDDDRFGLVRGGVYEIVVFQAERHPTGSNYQLTLDGFIAPRSYCSTDCGDSVRAGTEMCDGGRNMPSTGYNVCLNDCTFEFCGDGAVTGPETCDDGVNSDLYGTGCAPGCVAPARCGDGVVQAAFDEECDRGSGNQDGVYGGCTTQCKLGPYCGDGSVNGTEQCDTPGNFTTYGDSAGDCNYNCTFAPYCGDGVRNGNEICDGGQGCNSSCEIEPFCGDGVKTMDEPCDYGMFGFMGDPEDAPYGGCTTMCELGPYCGDDTPQTQFGEECDDGTANSDNVYEGCTTACLFGPRCGDAVVHINAGEACDNGFNEDDYAYPGAASPCGPDCSPVPYCGDGQLQSAFELCDEGNANDDGLYDGCTPTCEWGPYCGDGIENGPEECDEGADNAAYSADGDGCSYECLRNQAYCGDGIRNGPEQCDLGESDNTGEYGGCNEDCTRAPYCGDGRVQRSDGEQCDDGITGSLTCSPTCKVRDDDVT